MAEIGIAIVAQLASVAVTAAARKIGEIADGIGFDDIVFQLQRKLNRLQALLRDVDRAFVSQESEYIRLWIRDLQDAAFDAQDAIEVSAASGSGSTIIPSCSFSGFRKKGIFSFSMGSKISRINKTLDILEARGEALGLPRLVLQSASSDANLWRSSEVIFEQSFAPVDIEHKVESIVSLIKQHTVVAVVGMGGSGKTSLLQHVFKSIKSNHQESIWLAVSQSYSIEQLQLDVLGRLGIESQGESSSVLQQKIHDYLKGKTCLVVLDDVWDLPDREKQQNRYSNVANKLRSVGFPTDNKCRVLISTRDHQVAENFGSHIYPMPLLSEEKSNELFLKHLLPHSQLKNIIINEEKETLMKKLLKKCGGLPLAIIVIAGILKHRHPDEWDSTLQEMETSSTSSSSLPPAAAASGMNWPQTAVIKALRLSFDALEFSVKPCFAFLGIFAEDEEIKSEKLIGMWVAEGLVASEEEGISMLKHLSNRCLLHLKYPSRFGVHPAKYGVESRLYSITVHDLVHGLAVALVKETGGACQGSCSDEAFASELRSLGRRIRRISINGGCDSHHIRCPSSVRLLCFSHRSNVGPAVMKKSLSNVASSSFLRTLDLGLCNNVSRLPKCLRKFRLMQFLDISRVRLMTLPSSLRHLKQLQYLYINITQDVPPWVGELQSLRQFSNFSPHFLTWKTIRKRTRIPEMRVLTGICIELASENQGNQPQQWTWERVSQLKQLKQADIRVQKFESGIYPPETMESLRLRLKQGDPLLAIPEAWGLHLQRLEVLKLDNLKFTAGGGGGAFRKLKHLSLRGDAEDYPGEICRLPQLRILILLRNKKCQMLPQEFGSAEAFPQLHVLNMEALPELRMLPALEEGAMPRLMELSIVRCVGLTEAGNGWKDKALTLQRLKISRSNAGIKQSLDQQ